MSKTQKPKPPELYYEARSGAYWVRLPSGLFLEQDKSDIKLRLKRCGFYAGERDEGLSPAEEIMLRIQDEEHVHYAGALSGRRIGVHTLGSFRILVTSEPAGVYDKPKPGKFPAIEQFLDELLPDGQAEYFVAWLKIRVESLRAGVWQPGPAVVLTGPSSCGKSFLQFLVTQILGGRSASPMRYLSAQTQFNQDLSEAEHWAIEDERADMNHAARRDFGNAIKQATVNEFLSVHGKGLKAIQLPVWKALTISVNDEPEDLAILPPLTDAILNKLMLFKCGMATLSDKREENLKRFMPELPAFRAWLLKCPISAKLRTRIKEYGRAGHDCYHHPEVLKAVNGLSPEEQLLDLIDEIIFAANAKGTASPIWTGKAQKLQSELLESIPYRQQVNNLLKHANTCGNYLSRLARRYPERIEAYRAGGEHKWRISPERKRED
jgi:hypothetical protein